jgi:hypothetical protein
MRTTSVVVIMLMLGLFEVRVRVRMCHVRAFTALILRQALATDD